MKYYLRVCDLCPACIGPFDTITAAVLHYDWTKQQGDAAEFISINVVPPGSDDLLVLTPEEDKKIPRG